MERGPISIQPTRPRVMFSRNSRLDGSIFSARFARQDRYANRHSH